MNQASWVSYWLHLKDRLPLFSQRRGPGSDSRCDLPEVAEQSGGWDPPPGLLLLGALHQPWRPASKRLGPLRKRTLSHARGHTHSRAVLLRGGFAVGKRVRKGLGIRRASLPADPPFLAPRIRSPPSSARWEDGGPQGGLRQKAESSLTWEPASSKYTGLCQQRTGFCGNGGAQLRLPGAPATQRLPCQVCGSRPPAASAHGWACRSHTAWPRPDGQLSLLRTPGLP